MTSPELIVIAAVARNGVIGRDNTLPWRLKADMAHFRATTMGYPVLMGRKTWDSLGRPLAGRRNMVLTRNTDWQIAGAETFTDVDTAIRAVQGCEKIFVIGGAELYAAILPRANKLLITQVRADVLGDARFPDIYPDEFEEISRERHNADESNEYEFDFVEYRRRA